MDVNRLEELRFTIEPSILEIQDMTNKLQDIMSKLKFKAELLQEYRESKAYNGQVKMVLERAIKGKLRV